MRKGEAIEALIDLNVQRKYARSLATAHASHLKGSAARTFESYAREVDNCFALTAKALQALLKRRSPRR